MNKEQMLLLKVAEECNELGQVCSKMIRFGITNKKPNQNLNNIEVFLEELKDLITAIRYLSEEGILPNEPSFEFEEFASRKAKIDKYLQVSRDLGILKD